MIYDYVGGIFNASDPSRSLLTVPKQINMKPQYTLYFIEILLGLIFTGKLGAIKAKFPY
jgi:hypothetical protein